jgi:hypothetical protein
METEKFDEPTESKPGHPDSPVVDSMKELAGEGCFYKGSKYGHGARICWGGKVHQCSNGSWVNIGTKC